jgi:hypothetical protein
VRHDGRLQRLSKYALSLLGHLAGIAVAAALLGTVTTTIRAAAAAAAFLTVVVEAYDFLVHRFGQRAQDTERSEEYRFAWGCGLIFLTFGGLLLAIPATAFAAATLPGLAVDGLASYVAAGVIVPAVSALVALPFIAVDRRRRSRP